MFLIHWFFVCFQADEEKIKDGGKSVKKSAVVENGHDSEVRVTEVTSKPESEKRVWSFDLSLNPFRFIAAEIKPRASRLSWPKPALFENPPYGSSRPNSAEQNLLNTPCIFLSAWIAILIHLILSPVIFCYRIIWLLHKFSHLDLNISDKGDDCLRFLDLDWDSLESI